MIRRKRSKKIMTMNGVLIIYRTILMSTTNIEVKSKEIVPLDELLQIDSLPFKMTTLVMLEVAYMGQMMSSYEQASRELKRKLGYPISTSLVRDVTIFVGNLVFNYDEKRAIYTMENMVDSIVEETSKEESILYILTDGAALNTRVEDVNGSTWRENKLGMSFASVNIMKRGSNPKNGHTITKKEYTAFIGNASEFSKFIYQIAINQGYGKHQTTVVLGDGATWIRTMTNEIFPDAVQILDTFHLIENIYSYAKYIFKNNEKEYSKWSKKLIKYIEEGKIKKVIQEIEKIEAPTLANTVVNLKTYIKNNEDKIQYQEYIEKGYYIGSGSIESANKTILQKRLKQAGMRWSVSTAQAVLSLRAKVESGLWTQEVVSLVMNLKQE
jgi:hypothetical protein